MEKRETVKSAMSANISLILTSSASMYLRILGWRRVFSLLRANLAVWTFEKNPFVRQIKNQIMDILCPHHLPRW